MPTPSDHKDFNFSTRVYRRLLLLYPAPHRREYGAAMEQLFQDQCRDAWHDARGWGLAVLWLRVAGDLLRTATVEHFRELKRRIFMLNQIGLAFREKANVRTTFRVLFITVFLIVLSTSVLLAWRIPNQYASTSRIVVQRYPTDATSAAKQPNPGGGYDPYFIQNQFEVIQSDAVLGPVAKQLNLAETWGKTSQAGKRITEAEAIQQLRNRLELRVIRDTGLWQVFGVTLVVSTTNAAQIARNLPQRSLFEIRVLSNNPQEAAQIANAVAESYRQWSNEQIRETAMQLPRSHLVEIVDAAAPALRPIRPNRPFTIFMGFSSGLILAAAVGGIGVVLLLWSRRSSSSQATTV